MLAFHDPYCSDEAAKYHRVFKVETVGDCYVAACGLPNPRKDHACVMARFARDCINKTKELTRKLECILGPDTGDVSLHLGALQSHLDMD